MKTPKAKAVENRMLRAIAAYLQTQGFTPMAISADRVQGPLDRQQQYEFVVRFTGSKKEKESKDALSVGESARRR